MAGQKNFPLLMELGAPGRRAYLLPELDVPNRSLEELIPDQYLRSEPAPLPELSELEVVRHFTNLSRRNHGIDVGFYPLGSCTMKYNPKVNEDLASYPGFASLHPYQPEATVQGALQLMYELEEYLCEIAGLERATLAPAAGAHGELTGLMLIKAYHESRGEGHRDEIIIPDSAHGTNPASAAMCGYKVVEVASSERGSVCVDALRKVVGPKTAGLMLTNPNTLGLFEEDILTISEIVHGAGGLLYFDGANANAILGKCRPGDMGFDVVHFNLHKTFSTPHGGGGPGSGPIAVREDLVPFLPVPVVEKRQKSVDLAGTGQNIDEFYLDYDRPLSIGKIKGFYGNFLVMVRAYAYILSMGPEGLKQVSEDAVLAANYLMAKLKSAYELPYDRICKHEFVLSAKRQKANGVTARDIAKRLLDYDMHAPTVYFPLIVEEALMIEPTETETKAALDEFIDVMLAIAREAEESPEKLQKAPYHTVVGRLDETLAARHPVVRWQGGKDMEAKARDE
ncbi:MAG: aminomethyl-transferring glycine dehydrogenase subunit GcvPB [Firmicutes bacterium]|nr:aminomethyl-transferring glycine dehydrogenase subunit GcvPB [Bacillota bacterium]